MSYIMCICVEVSCIWKAYGNVSVIAQCICTYAAHNHIEYIHKHEIQTGKKTIALNYMRCANKTYAYKRKANIRMGAKDA